MNREEKTVAVTEIASQIEESHAVFAVDYRGISVPQAAELRSKLRDSDASFRVVKNRLTKLAADKAGREDLKELLEGPTALTFVRGDTASAAKTITTFTREHEVLVFKGGFMDDVALDPERFTAIARLPSRDVLIGQFAGVVASPITGLVRGLGSLISGLALQLGQIAEQGLVSGEAPAANEDPPAVEDPPADGDPPAEEPADEDAPAVEAPAEAGEEEAPPEEQPAAEAPDMTDSPADVPAEEPPTESAAEADAGDPAEAESTETESTQTEQTEEE